MQTTLLKKLDALCRLYPRHFNFLKQSRPNYLRPCIIRPGGLGDLVVLTRACRDLKIDLHTFDWIVEKRNASWLDFHGVNHRCYDKPQDIYSIISDYGKYSSVIVTEQYHGLAAAVGAYLRAADGQTIGFDSNPRADLYQQTTTHRPTTNHELQHFSQLLQLASLPTQNIQSTQTAPKQKGHIVLAFAGEYQQEKALHINDWEKLLSHAANFQLPVYLLGTKKFSHAANTLCRNFPTAINQVGKITFNEVVKTIQTAKRFVGIDSGLMHVADFYNIPSDVIFLDPAITQWCPLTAGSNLLKASSL